MIYEGFVTNLKEDGKAEVVIQPPGAGVPGVSEEINARVCHCATPASTITVEALNPAGAGVGDTVSITRDATALLKNWCILLGIPFTGLITGIVLAFLLTCQLSIHPAAGIATGVIFALVAAVFSKIWYTKTSTGNDPVIDRIIKTGGGTGTAVCSGTFPSARESGVCGACSGNLL